MIRKRNINLYISLLLGSFILWSCQKLDRPGLGEYTPDSNPPGGPLNFYVAFDGTSTSSSMNAVDSIRATLPTDNPLGSTDGVNGKAMQGENKKFIKFARPNDWILKSKSFTISVWVKRNGQTKNNIGDNGPEHIFGIPSSTDHWSKSCGFLLLEGNNAACAIKLFLVDKNKADAWLTWEQGNSVPGILDNAWHHLVFSYDAATSKVTFYKDGVANPVVPTWGGHGDINIDNSVMNEFRIGVGPASDYDSGDWLSSTFKGALDQFRLYSKALTAAEVKALFDSKQ